MKSALSKITDFAARITGAKDALSSLHAADTELREAHAAAELERNRHIVLPPPREDLLKELDRDISGLAQSWRDQRATGLLATLAGSVQVAADGSILGTRRHANIAEDVGVLDLAALCAIAPELVRSALGATISALRVEHGPPMADRVRLLAEVDAKTAALEAAHQQLVDEAAAVGIVIDELPVNRGRRIRAEQKKERDEREARDARLRHV